MIIGTLVAGRRRDASVQESSPGEDVLVPLLGYRRWFLLGR